MKRLLMAMALTCAFACSISAGDIPSDGSPAPSPSGDLTITTDPGDVQTPSQEFSSDALSALLSVLSFLAV